jgi:exosortase
VTFDRIAPALVGVALALVYAPVLRDLLHVWLTDTYAAHGLLVAPFSAWVVISDRERLRGLVKRPRPSGWIALLLGLGILLAGWSVGSCFLEAISAPVLVSGWVLATLGPDHLRTLAFPVGFLLFLAPLPHAAVDVVSLHLQRFAAWFGAQAATLLGVPVYQEGVVIHMASGLLRVAEVCNGLRFMTALVVLTVALAHTVQLRPARQVVLVASAVPLAVLANAIRVATIVVGAHYFGPRAASGLIHHLIGKAVWILTLLPLGLLAWGLRRNQTGTRVIGMRRRRNQHASQRLDPDSDLDPRPAAGPPAKPSDANGRQP